MLPTSRVKRSSTSCGDRLAEYGAAFAMYRHAIVLVDSATARAPNHTLSHSRTFVRTVTISAIAMAQVPRIAQATRMSLTATETEVDAAHRIIAARLMRTSQRYVFCDRIAARPDIQNSAGKSLALISIRGVAFDIGHRLYNVLLA
jgi:hypothetical protein